MIYFLVKVIAVVFYKNKKIFSTFEAISLFNAIIIYINEQNI